MDKFCPIIKDMCNDECVFLGEEEDFCLLSVTLYNVYNEIDNISDGIERIRGQLESNHNTDY